MEPNKTRQQARDDDRLLEVRIQELLDELAGKTKPRKPPAHQLDWLEMAAEFNQPTHLAYNQHKPLPTLFNGIEFKSRLEARWAMFFEHAGYFWEYEPHTYTLDNGAIYTPDFLVHRGFNQHYCEMKYNGGVSDLVVYKANQIERITGVRCVIYDDKPSDKFDICQENPEAWKKAKYHKFDW